MFEQYDECHALQYTSGGKRIAAYNTKLHMCRTIREEEFTSVKQKSPAVPVYPSGASQKRKQEVFWRVEKEETNIKDTISEAEAVVRYHCFQNKKMIRDGLVRVIDIHKHDTDITVVRKEANGMGKVRFMFLSLIKDSGFYLAFTAVTKFCCRSPLVMI